MTFLERVEKLQQEYTDKYVVVDANRPELARFKGFTGHVKTVNMSGRALVEFDDYHLNIGWYDIELDFLKIVAQPLPKEEKTEKHKPAKAAAPPAAKAPAAEKPAAKPAGQSAAAILAPARAAKPAAAAPESKPAAPAAGKKLSAAEMIAAARGKSAPPPAAKVEAPPPPPPPEPEAEVAAEPEPESAPEPVVSAPASSPSKTARKKLTSFADMIAWCRENDLEG